MLLYFDCADCNVEGRATDIAASPVGEESLLFSLLDGVHVPPDVIEHNVGGHDILMVISRSGAASYPSFAKDGRSIWSVIVHMIIPALILCGGILTSLAVLANFDYV